MIYLEKFMLPDSGTEEDYLEQFTKRTCYDTYYPFQIFYNRELPPLEFEDITIFYGGNGSGKSTILNVIAERLGLARDSVFNKSNFYQDYVNSCRFFMMPGVGAVPEDSRIITSDDVFDYLLDVRCLNQNIDNRREELMQEYTELRYSRFRMKSLDDLDQLKKSNQAKSKSQSSFIRSNVMNNVRERSNGESAFSYFTSKIRENALYILDEPENSLSTKLQTELKQFIIDSMRGFKCQFIIATHSPFMLSIPCAKIYDLDCMPPQIKAWTELESMRDYYELFMEYRGNFTSDMQSR